MNELEGHMVQKQTEPEGNAGMGRQMVPTEEENHECRFPSERCKLAMNSRIIGRAPEPNSTS